MKNVGDTLNEMLNTRHDRLYAGTKYNETFVHAYNKINIPLFRVCGHGISSSIELALLKIKGTK